MISIIIPFNNGKKYLGQCLEDLRKIEYLDFEVILIDDFSLDESEKIVKEFLNKLDNKNNNMNINYYYTKEKTIGVGNARNLGIEKANGDYIIFLDVDDELDKDLFQNINDFIDKDIEIIKYKMTIISKDEEILEQGPAFCITEGQDAFNKLCFDDKFLDSPCIYCIKKELFERTKLKFEKNIYHEDFGLIPQLIVNAKSVLSIDYYGYKYFQTKNSIMRNENYENKIRKINDKFTLYTKLYQNLNKYNLKIKTKKNLLEYYTNSIITSIKNLKLEDRKNFEKRIKNRGLIKNVQVKNFRKLIKKIVLKINMEWYFKWLK